METILLFIVFVVLIAVPFFLALWFFQQVREANLLENLYKEEFQLLEIKLPPEIHKSPVAMEIFIESLHNPSDDDLWWKEIKKGLHRPWYSLEIASDGGKISFYIWTAKVFRPNIEAQLYAQFPEVEIKQVDDYTNIDFKPGEKYNTWGFELVLAKDEALPIKTYVDYGMDKDYVLDPEKRIDPLAGLLSFLSTLDPDEKVWIQYVIRASKPEKDFWSREEKTWQDDAKKKIEEIMKRDQTVTGPEGQTFPLLEMKTKGETDMVEAIERSLSKKAFDVGLRCLYLYPEGKVNHARKPSMVSSMFLFNSGWFNSFKVSHITSLDYVWQDFLDKRIKAISQELFDAYQRRAFFLGAFGEIKVLWWVPKKIRKTMILTTEELTTLFHFPSQTVESVDVDRVESKRVPPPSNLPIE